MSFLYLFIFIILLYIIGNFYKSKETYINNTVIPKKLWVFWHVAENESSDLIKLSYKSMRKMLPDYEFNQINFNNYKNFVDDKQIITIIDNVNIPINYKSDLIRLYLINRYGGVYLDASTLLLQPLDWINMSGEFDTIMCINGDHTTDKNKPVLESWFIVSKPNQQFLSIVLKILTKILSDYENINNHYQTLINQPDVNYQNFKDHGVYHLIYFIMIYTQFKYNITTKLHFIDCTSYKHMFPYKGENACNIITELYLYPIDNYSFNEILNNKLIKITSYVRDCIDKLQYVPNSFMDKYIKLLQ